MIVPGKPQHLMLWVIRGAVTGTGHEERVLIDLHTPAVGGGARMVGYTIVAIPDGIWREMNWSDPEGHFTGSNGGTVAQDVISLRVLAPARTGRQMGSLQLMVQQVCTRVPTIGGVEQDLEEEDDIPEDGYPVGLLLPTILPKAMPRLLQMPSAGPWSWLHNGEVHTIWMYTGANVADDPFRLAQARLISRTYMMSQIRRPKSSSDDEGGDQGNVIAISFDRYKVVQTKCKKADFDEKDEDPDAEATRTKENEAKAEAHKKRQEEAARKPE
jgi:hypothetical protein